jgi:NarL family two-component system response regulator LiaR
MCISGYEILYICSSLLFEGNCMSAIRVLIADDHPIVREGLRTLVSSEPGLELVGEAVNGAEVICKSRALKPDVIILDLIMPIKSGLEAIKEIKKENNNVSILVLTSFAEEELVFPAIKAGALGYLLKDSSPDQLLQAIYNVYHGEASLHPTIALQLIHEISQSSNLPLSADPLSERELQVLRLVARGLSNQEVGNVLMISEWTVRTHVRNILSKLHLANRTQATLYALREGIAGLEDR